MSAGHLEVFQIPSECNRLQRLLSASDNEKKFFEDVILKNLFSLEKHESVTLVSYPSGHIDLRNLPKEMFEAVEKILERKAKEK
jgi:hypothetical protein